MTTTRTTDADATNATRRASASKRSTRRDVRAPGSQTEQQAVEAARSERLGPASDGHPLVGLQQRHGNQAVQRLVRGRRAADSERTSGPADNASAERQSPPAGRTSEDQTGSANQPATSRPRRDGSGRRRLPPEVAATIQEPTAGRPLPSSTRRFMEDRFGVGFDRVRVHTDGPSTAAARRLDARAFTHGTDIFVGAGQYRPSTPDGQRLVAHELAHVVQQRTHGGPAGEPTHVSRSTDPAERDARAAVRAVETGERPTVARSTEPAVVHRFSVGDFASSVAGSIADAGSSVLGTAVDVAEAGIEVVADVGRALVDRVAPGLLDYLEDPVGAIRSALCAGVDALVGGAFGLLESIDFVGVLESVTGGGEGGQAAPKQQAAPQQQPSQAPASEEGVLESLMGSLVGALETYGIPLLHSIQDAIGSVRETFDSIWQSIVEPAANLLGDAAGALWDGVVAIAERVWGLVEPLWEAASGVLSRAWDWITDVFDIAWESSEDTRSWLAEAAESVWESLKAMIEPVLAPVRDAWEFLSEFTGDVITAMEETVAPVWEKIKWLWNNWSAADLLVTAQEFLRTQVLPPLLSGVSAVDQAIATVADVVTNAVTGASRAVVRFVEGIGVTECLESVSRAASYVAEQFTRLSEWATGAFAALMNGVRSGLTALVDSLEPILGFLVKLATVIANPLGLPGLLLGELWSHIPDRFKPPIVTFLVELLLTFVRGVGMFISAMGPLGRILEETIVGFLTRIRDASDEVKIDASNRIARLLSGSIEFIGGFLWGTLKGIWEGITDPFVLIGLIVQAGVGVSRFLSNLFSRDPVEARRTDAPGDQQTPGGPPGTATSESPRDQPVPVTGSPRPETAATAPAAAAPAATTAGPASTAGRATSAGAGGETASPQLEALMPSSSTAAELDQAAQQTAGTESEWESGVERAGSRDSATSEGLFNLLSTVWNTVIGMASDLGSYLAEKLLEFLDLSDYQLGEKLGWLAGTVLFEVLLNALTAAAYAGVSASRHVLRAIVRFLDLGGEILGGLVKLLGKVRQPLMKGLGAIGGFIERIPGLGTVFRKVASALRAVFRYADEATAGLRGARTAGGEAAEAAGGRAARETADIAGETVEDAGERVARDVLEDTGARAGREAVEATGERTGREAVEETGERAGRETAEEAGERAGKRGDDAAKAAELPQAITAAKAITEEFDRRNAPAPAMRIALNALTRRFRWIDRFDVEPKGRPGLYEVYMIASREPIDRHVDLSDDADVELPEGGITIEERAMQGGNPPRWARERPGMYYYDTRNGVYRRRRDDAIDLTPDEIADEVAREGRKARKDDLRETHRAQAIEGLMEDRLIDLQHLDEILEGRFPLELLQEVRDIGMLDIPQSQKVRMVQTILGREGMEFHHAPRLGDLLFEVDPGAKSHFTTQFFHRFGEHGGDTRRALEMGEPADRLRSLEPGEAGFEESFGWGVHPRESTSLLDSALDDPAEALNEISQRGTLDRIGRWIEPRDPSNPNSLRQSVERARQVRQFLDSLTRERPDLEPQVQRVLERLGRRVDV